MRIAALIPQLRNLKTASLQSCIGECKPRILHDLQLAFDYELSQGRSSGNLA
jgi:hypothetical protein